MHDAYLTAKILADHQNDLGLGDDGYASSGVARRHHRQAPDNSRPGLYAPFYGSRSHCFAVTTLGPQPPAGMVQSGRRPLRSRLCGSSRDDRRDQKRHRPAYLQHI